MKPSSIELQDDCSAIALAPELPKDWNRDAASIVEVIRSTAAFAALQAEWNILLEASASRCLFLTWEWLFTWWKHLAAGRELSIIAVRSGSDRELVALAPFAIKTTRIAALPVRTIEFLGTGTVSSDHLDMIIKPGSEERAIRAVAEYLAGQSIAIKLVHFDRGSSFVSQLAAQLQSSGWTASETTLVRAPFISLAGQSWESYLDSLSGNDRRALRRRFGKLNKEFTVRIDEARTEEERARALSLLFELHEKGWRERGGSKAFSNPAVRAFHDEVSRLMLERGWLRLFVQWLDGRPAGARYGFRYGRTYYSYQGGFDPEFARQGIGILTFALAIRNSLEEGAQEHDLLAGDDEYKCRLAPQSRELGRMELYPPGVGWALYKQALASYRAIRKNGSRVHRAPATTVKLLQFAPSFGIAGTERQVVNLGFALDPSRYALHFGCMNRFGQLLEKIEAGGFPILHYGVRTFRHPKVLAAQFRLAREIRRRGIQIVHTYGFYANLFAIPAAKLGGARIVASIRDMGVYLSPKQRIAQRLICKLADHILVNATAIKDWLVSDGYEASRITVIPNGIDMTRFNAAERTGSLHRDLGIPAGAPLIGVIGRVARLKGIDDFLRAATIIAPRFPTARFLIVGDSGTFVAQGGKVVEDNRYEQELKRLTAELGLQDRVAFAGFRPDIERVLCELAVSVQPSLSEGMSNTLLESMAAGVPVVATRVGGACEVIRHGENGLLVPPGNPDAIAEAVCQMLDVPAAASSMGHAARQSIAEHYSMTRVVERTSRVYDSLLQRTSRAMMRTIESGT
jgi:glycosyltransferase involved in cell wall biosynthesis/CelD/BcsL family acetyltransferase involved in cellulose biosynthesis